MINLHVSYLDNFVLRDSYGELGCVYINVT